ncbi:cytochrome P450 [Micromonospora sp. NPDC048830]|uniref:cytochrome P450 n=1 Tax=Micromonospora sp. NPDC048830 TaxID=3364257 RepID=UPI003724B18F
MTLVGMGPSEALARLFTSEGKRDPYPLYDALWPLGPAFRLGPELVMVLGYDECSAALRHRDLLVTDADAHLRTGLLAHSTWQCFTKIMMFSNEPDHGRLRQFAGDAYSPRQVARLRPAAVDQARTLIADLSGRVDLVAAYTYPFTMAVTGDLLGIPSSDRDALRVPVLACTTAFEPILTQDELAAADAGMDVLTDYFRELIRHRRRHPSDDLTGTMVRDGEATGAISEEELVASLVLFLIAGTQTPSDVIGNAVQLVVSRRLPAHDLVADPGTLSDFITEAVRIDPAIHMLTRVAARDLELGGVHIAAGSRVLLTLAAANRDPRRFGRQDEFDVGREGNAPLAFGLGTHYCLGASFAKLLVDVALAELLRRFPAMSLASEPSYREQLVQRGLADLVVNLEG